MRWTRQDKLRLTQGLGPAAAGGYEMHQAGCSEIEARRSEQESWHVFARLVLATAWRREHEFQAKYYITGAGRRQGLGETCV